MCCCCWSGEGFLRRAVVRRIFRVHCMIMLRHDRDTMSRTVFLIHMSNSHGHAFPRRRAGCAFGSLPFDEGRRSAERRALGIVPRRIRLTERTAAAETPSGAPSAAIFKDRGPCFRAGHRFPKISLRVSVDLRRISPPASQPRPANLWQPLVVAADGSPRPPGRHGCETTSRRRRIPFRVTTPHDALLANETQGIYSYSRRMSIAMMQVGACAMLSIIGPETSSSSPRRRGPITPVVIGEGNARCPRS